MPRVFSFTLLSPPPPGDDLCPTDLPGARAFLFLPMGSERSPYGYKWQQASRAFLACHPLCQCPQCAEGRIRVRAASVVDHRVPHRLVEALKSGDAIAIATAQKLFWDHKNWQSMAKDCHDSYKQRLEKSGRIAGATADGVPLDPNHHWHRRAG